MSEACNSAASGWRFSNTALSGPRSAYTLTVNSSLGRLSSSWQPSGPTVTPEEYRRRSKEAGFNLHMVKPVEAAAFEKLLAGVQATTAYWVQRGQCSTQ